MALMNAAVNWTQPKKESASLQICEWKFPKLQCGEKKINGIKYPVILG